MRGFTMKKVTSAITLVFVLGLIVGGSALLDADVSQTVSGPTVIPFAAGDCPSGSWDVDSGLPPLTEGQMKWCSHRLALGFSYY